MKIALALASCIALAACTHRPDIDLQARWPQPAPAQAPVLMAPPPAMTPPALNLQLGK